jgi:hypothetical protein
MVRNRPNPARAAHRRAALRTQGLRPRPLWLPHLRSASARLEIKDAVAAINRSMAASDDVAFIGSLTDELLDILPPYYWTASVAGTAAKAGSILGDMLCPPTK